MAFAQAKGSLGQARFALAALALLSGIAAVPAEAENGAATVAPPARTGGAPAEALDPSLSPECRVPGSKLYTLARLKAVKTAIAEKRPIRVLSVGSSSAGLGTSASYPVRLENALERSMPNVDIEVDSRGLPGEIASGAGERLRSLLAEVEPDLLVWQVGTNDALARVDIDSFGEALEDDVKYVKSHEIDVVLIDPLFTQSLADDEYYNDLVRKVQEVASHEGVPLVRRYEAMRFLSATGEGGDHMLGQQFRLNDLGLRCMAEHVSRAITLSLLKSDQGVTGTVPPPRPQPQPPGSPGAQPPPPN